MRRSPHPFLFFLLILPFGSAYGFAAVALQYLAVEVHHVTAVAFTTVTAAAFAVHGVKMLWAPVVDATMSKRRWYLIALVLIWVGVMASSMMPISPDTLHQLTLVVMASQIGLTLMGMACENFLADLPEDQKGRASGWYQAGNIIGLGVGGGVTLTLSKHFSHTWIVGAILCASMIPSAAVLYWIPEPNHHGKRIGEAVRQLGRDAVDLVVRRLDGRLVLSFFGLTGLLIAISPVGSGAASNLFPSIAEGWKANADDVALVNGWLGGVVGGVGALAGGWLADRMNRRFCYAIAGGLTAVTGVVFALAPRTPQVYFYGVLVYGFFNGVAFAAFSAFVLETIGRGAAATKYNIFAGLANFAITYMTKVDGWAYGEAKNATHLLYVDAGWTAGGIGVLVVLTLLAKKLQPGTVPAVGVEGA